MSFPVSARTRVVFPWSTCPAVPTVSATARTSGRACGESPHSPAGPEHRPGGFVDLRVRKRAGVEEQPAVADDADHRRVAEPQRHRERLLDRARGARELGEWQCPSADARDRVLGLAADEAREPLRPLAHALERLVEHPQHRNLTARALGIGVEGERPLERGERQLVGAQRALQRLAAEALDELAAADHDPRLRPTEQLVAGEADEIRTGGEARRGRRLVADVGQRAGAEVVDEPDAGPRGDRRELLGAGALGEPDDPEVRLVHTQKERRVGADRALVVQAARPVRGADLDHPRAGAREHVRDPEAVADLDKLAARDDDLTAVRERREREQHRARVVVDDERALRAGQTAKRPRDVILSRAARARIEVELEIRVRGADLGDTLERHRRERRAPEVGMDDHAGRVQHATQPGRREPGELGAGRLGDVAGLLARLDRCACLVERTARSRGRERARSCREHLVGEQPVDRREVAKAHGHKSRS